MKTFLRILHLIFHAKSAFFMGNQMLKLVFAGAVFLLLAFLYFGLSGVTVFLPQNPQRIISLAPAITETLHALGAGQRVAGVTKFCLYPPDAASKPKVSGFQEVNFEAMLRQNPDLAILPADMAYLRKNLEALGIPVFLFSYQSLPDFLESVKKTGELLAREKEAERLIEHFRLRAEDQAQKPGLLFVIAGPDDRHQPPQEMTIIGNTGFYNDLINAAGARNAYEGKIAYPRISMEAALAMDPEIIVIAAPDIPKESLMKFWKGSPLFEKGDRKIVLLDDPGDTIPGPRSLSTYEKIANAVNDVRGSQ